MKSRKTYVGPRLRQLRRTRKESQAQMAKSLGVSPSYINLLENNQRSLSVQVLLRLSEVYGVDWRDMVDDDASTLLSDLRKVFQDPVFGVDKPDLQELRAALVHCPLLASNLMTLYKSYEIVTDRLMSISDDRGGSVSRIITANPETVVHDLFRRHKNHFPMLEEAAADFRRDALSAESSEFYSCLKRRMKEKLGIEVATVASCELPLFLREYDEQSERLLLSESLDYPNKVFQITHVAGLLEYEKLFDGVIESASIKGGREQARCRVELANYFAAAVLMPYEAFLRAAQASRYNLDHLATRFGVSVEQAGHRLTTLGRDGASGIPFFFLRIDRAGNVTKRFNATSFHLADHGGACPRWDVHMCFRTPGRIMPQFVEMPDGSKFFTFSRTAERPASGRPTGDNRLAITLGCAIEYAPEIAYASPYQLSDPNLVTPIGINCRLCPRQQCSQRAYQPIHLELPIDEHRRGQTRFES